VAWRLDRPAPDPPAEGSCALEVTLSPMRRRHLRAVLRIEAQVYPRPWSASLFLSELALRSSRAYTVARVGPAVVGYSGLMVTGDEAHVTTVAVDPRWQRHKVGTRLMLHMVRLAQGRGARAMTLEVRVGNAEAQGLYRQFGFMPAGIRKNYYVETNEDALVMWAEHIDGDDYRCRLARIEAGLSGSTVVEDPQW
jgi:ribosomal-protein-alanine N-acetyltransferase